jgi:hypothetical protein
MQISDEGTICWYNKKGEFHRLDGPAIERADGSKAYYINGKAHRLYGPAIERADGSKEYWIDGKELTEEEFNNRKLLLYLYSWANL